MGGRKAFLKATIPLKPERQAELEEFARQRGKTPADALDEALAAYLEWERQDFEEAIRGIEKGFEDVKAGRTRPAGEFLRDMRRKHGISG
jgi:predicted transcriptional regulator